jgi:hypothetical protein
MFNPNFRITPSITMALLEIEACRQAVMELPIDVGMLKSLRETARIASTHYSTMIDGNRLTSRTSALLGAQRIVRAERQRFNSAALRAGFKSRSGGAIGKRDDSWQAMLTVHVPYHVRRVVGIDARCGYEQRSRAPATANRCRPRIRSVTRLSNSDNRNLRLHHVEESSAKPWLSVRAEPHVAIN